MEEKEITVAGEENKEGQPNNGEILSPELLVAVADIILEYKKSGSIKMSQLFDKLEKYETTPVQLEEIYKEMDI